MIDTSVSCELCFLIFIDNLNVDGPRHFMGELFRM